MNVEELEKSGLIIYKYIAGSHAYGMATPESDTDIRGVFMLPKHDRDSLFDAAQEIANDSQDIKYFELRKFIKLAADNNPNVIEAFYMPKETIISQSSVMDYLISMRHHFLSKKAIITHLSYAFGQIKKATGRNKLVNNPKSKERPCKEDFCYFIHIKKPVVVNNIDEKLAKMLTYDQNQKIWTTLNANKHLYEDEYFYNFAARIRNAPCRPVPVNELKLDLSKYHVAALEHVPHTYRLYYYGDAESKGVFSNDTIVPQSIPLEDEYPRFIGLFVYNQAEYEREVIEWKNYWEWVNSRNEDRWKLQESGKLDYDVKNMAHTMRLLFVGEDIVKKGEITIRFEGEKLQLLKDIRAGKYTYEYLIKLAEDKKAEVELMKDQCSLPYEADMKMINNIYQECFKL